MAKQEELEREIKQLWRMLIINNFITLFLLIMGVSFVVRWVIGN